MVKVKETYKKLTILQKGEILDKLDRGASVNSLCLTYKINKTTIYRIKANANRIRNFITNVESGAGKRKTLKKAEYPKMEKALYSWFILQRKSHIPISTDILKVKAEYYHKKYETGSFFASAGWVANFKKRHGIRRLKICGEKLSNIQVHVNPFLQKLEAKKKEMNLTDEQIYNADESGLFYKLLPDKTLASIKENSAPGRKINKERVTFLVCANATGSHKLPLMVIGKAANPRAFKNFRNTSIPVIYKSSKNAWMTSFLFKDWFQNIFIPKVQQYLEAKGLEKKALLILDNAPCHMNEEQLKSEDGCIQTMFLPPNCTALVQPMDQNVINLLKLYYKKSFLTSLVASNGLNLAEKIKMFNLRDAVYVLASAWDKLRSSMIAKCWKVLEAPHMEWTNEDYLPLSEIQNKMRNEESLPVLLNDVDPSQNYSFQEAREWLNDNEENNCVELEEQVGVSDSEDFEEPEAPVLKKIKTVDVINALHTCIAWSEQNGNTVNELLTLQNMKERAVMMNLLGKKSQKHITDFYSTNVNT